MVSLISPHICFSEGSEDVDDHLAEFSYVNESHHDNIDGDYHAHKHKHSEDGEEHEHSHDHNQIVHVEIKVFTNSSLIFNDFQKIESQKINHLSFLISDPHPYEIFRPPISA
tara:strand:- start:4186 stop:4521 length:336 start_codon:yes stop_codon:yes gene_type:complete